jgi:8-oxo-dGTP pyrophosphatase MutT (NUDIX family)
MIKQAACLLIVRNDGLVLTTTRRNTDILALPGGKVDVGESAARAALRETYEETALVFQQADIVPVYAEVLRGDDGREFFCTTFAVKAEAGELAHGKLLDPDTWMIEAGIKVRYASTAELLQGAFAEYNAKVLDNAARLPAFAPLLGVAND